MTKKKKYDATHRCIIPDLPGTITPISYDLPPDLGCEEWLSLCYDLAGAIFCMGWKYYHWVVGDILRYGQLHFPDWMKGIDAVLPLLGRKACLKCGNIAGAIAPADRRHQVRFWHHARVASLPQEQQQEVLGLAVKHGWTRDQIREAVEAREATIRPAAATQPATPLPVSCTSRVLAGLRAVVAQVRRRLAA